MQRLPRYAIAALLAFAGCSPDDDGHRSEPVEGVFPLRAVCEVPVSGVGVRSVEDDYLARVVACEIGDAPLEALKAQAVAARSYLYYRMYRSGSIRDGQIDQVYSCGWSPNHRHRRAVADTAGEVLTYRNRLVAGFFVAGAPPSARSCKAGGRDPDATDTERFVTYNAGRIGRRVQQTPLGYIDRYNRANRGCMSQNGASCLARKGWRYRDILRFYYGVDIAVDVAQGMCVPSG